MAYFHQRIRTRIRIPNPIVTLYYAQLFPLVGIRIQIPVQIASRMVTVPILVTDLHPRDRSPSLFHTFESGDQSPNPNQWKIPAQYRNPNPSVEISHYSVLTCAVSSMFSCTYCTDPSSAICTPTPIPWASSPAPDSWSAPARSAPCRICISSACSCWTKRKNHLTTHCEKLVTVTCSKTCLFFISRLFCRFLLVVKCTRDLKCEQALFWVMRFKAYWRNVKVNMTSLSHLWLVRLVYVEVG